MEIHQDVELKHKRNEHLLKAHLEFLAADLVGVTKGKLIVRVKEYPQDISLIPLPDEPFVELCEESKKGVFRSSARKIILAVGVKEYGGVTYAHCYDKTAEEKFAIYSNKFKKQTCIIIKLQRRGYSINQFLS